MADKRDRLETLYAGLILAGLALMALACAATTAWRCQ